MARVIEIGSADDDLPCLQESLLGQGEAGLDMTMEPFPGLFEASDQKLTTNHLFYGDNLTIMRRMPSACVDLIYLDPPFNSQRNYNLIYKRLTGAPVPEQEEAFCDAWEMDQEKEEMARAMPALLQHYDVPDDVVMFWRAWMDALRHTQPRLLAYLIYMTYRLFEMRRILKNTGSIYLHCDPNASHYIKIIMDAVFGHANFRSEIIWKRTGTHSSANRWGPVHDVILMYGKSSQTAWNRLYLPLDEGHQARHYANVDAMGRPYTHGELTAPGVRHGRSGEVWRGFDVSAIGRHWMTTVEKLDALDAEGRIYFPKEGGWPRFIRYIDESRGRAAGDVWTDIPPINMRAHERLGYPTQKPLALLERIITASTKEGDVVFDPFAGCGTAVFAAHLLGRKWIGCDIAILSVQIVRDVLLKRYGLKEHEHYAVDGVPRSKEAALELFNHDPRQFQHWSVELAGGFASTKNTGDRGIDGRIHFETSSGLRNMVISVKGGQTVNPAFVRELVGTVQQERKNDTEMGGFVCLAPITRGMRTAAADAGMFKYLGKDYERVQLRTVEELLNGHGFDTPSKVQTLGWATQQAVMPL